MTASSADANGLRREINQGKYDDPEGLARDERAKVGYYGSDGTVMTPATVPTMPNAPGTPRRTIRVPDEEWAAALAKAAERGESLPEEIRKFLRRYARKA